MRPNPSLKRSANGRPPGPVWRYAVHFRQPVPGVLPLPPGYLHVKFHLAFFYFVDTIKYAHMGRTKAQAEPQESRA